MDQQAIEGALKAARLDTFRSSYPSEYASLIEFTKTYSDHYALLRSLDDEQQVSCLARGRAMVSAGAGSGKTYTLQTRLRLLLARGVEPSRIVTVTFNRAAAQEIRDRVADVKGAEQLVIGTMHSVFGRYVAKFGSPIQKEAIESRLVSDESRSSRAPSLRQFSGFLWRVWHDCREGDPPRGVANIVQRWQAEGLTPAQARESALTVQEAAASDWFEWWQGFRGVLGPKWKPPCETADGSKFWASFMARYRSNPNYVLGEINDMVQLFDQLLRERPDIAKQVADQIQYLLIDEGQDLNATQHRIVANLITAGLEEVWIVGDERQSINAFVGASPELFSGLRKQGFFLNQITTNYRSLPEIVELANALMANHGTELNIDSRPDPAKPRGQADIRLIEAGTHEEVALRIIGQIRSRLADDAQPENFAVLARTNLELDAYESACILASVPYTRRGGHSFLRSPEVQAVRAYLNVLVLGDVDAVAGVLDKPARLFLRQDEAPLVIAETAKLLDEQTDGELTVERLFSDSGIKAMLQALGRLKGWARWQLKAAEEELERLGRALIGMRKGLAENGYTSRSLLQEILTIDGAAPREGKKRPTLAEVLLPFGGDDETEVSVPDSSEAQPLGSLDFVFALIQGNTQLLEPGALVRHLQDLEDSGNELSYSSREWQEAQAMLPVSERLPIPAVTLSTVHSVKGLQWDFVVVVMGPSVFPWKFVRDVPLNEQAKPMLIARAEKDLRTERQLAYVAWTRAKRTLWLLSPARSAYAMAGDRSEFLTGAVAPVLQDLRMTYSALPALADVIQSTPTFETRKSAAKRSDALSSEDVELLRQFGLSVQQTETTPTKESKAPRPVWIINGRTQEHFDVLKSAGGRLFARTWSFYEDPTQRLAELLRLKVKDEPAAETPIDRAAELLSSGWEAVSSVDVSGLLDRAKQQGAEALSKALKFLSERRSDLAGAVAAWTSQSESGAEPAIATPIKEDDAATLSRHRIKVIATQTTPKKAGKQPKPVWNVEGLTAPLDEYLRDAGGKKFLGKWSFWSDPTSALAERLRSEGAPSAERRADYRADRSAKRAERLRGYAAKQEAEAARRLGTAKGIGDKIPFGQPVLVGHHSQRRHERDLARIETNMRKGFEAHDASQQLSRRADVAERNAAQNWSVVYLMNRIKEREAQLRALERDAEKYPKIGVEQRAEEKARLDDDLSYYQELLEAKGGLKFTSSNVKKGDEVLFHGKWYPVARVNRLSVTVRNWLDTERLKGGIPYEKIKGVRTPEQATPAATQQDSDSTAQAEPVSEKKAAPASDSSAARAEDELCDPEVQTCELGMLGGTCGVQSVLLVRDGEATTTIKARYCLTDIRKLIPSHVSPAQSRRENLPVFSPRADYPANVQERRYDRQAESVKVQRIAASMVPEEVVSLVSNPLTGPPIATAQGWVLGGNGRTMGIDSYYEDHPAPNLLTQHLQSVAGQFGFDPSAIASIERPVIVRVVDTLAGRNRRSVDDIRDNERRELVNLVRVTNFSTAQGLDSVSASVSASRALDDATIGSLAEGMGSESLSEYLDSHDSAGFVSRLVANGILPANEPTWFAGAKRLSTSGKQLVERMLAARLVPDADLLDSSEELRRSLAQMAPYLLAAQWTSKSHNLASVMPAVVRDWLSLRASGTSLDNYFRQGALFSGQGSVDRSDPRHRPMVAFLHENIGRYRILAKAARTYLQEASEFVSTQLGMFSTTKEPESTVFQRIFVSTYGPKGS